MENVFGIRFICELPAVLPSKTFKAMDVDLTKFLGTEMEYRIHKAGKSMYDSHGFNISAGDFYIEMVTVGSNEMWNADTIEIAIAVINRHIEMKINGEFIYRDGAVKVEVEDKKISDEEYEKMIRDLAKNIVGKHI
jgi:hypothetical protein